MLGKQVEFSLGKDFFDDKLKPYLFSKCDIISDEFKKAGFDITVKLGDSGSLIFSSPFGDLFTLAVKIGDGFHNYYLTYIVKIIHPSLSEELIIKVLTYVKNLLLVIIKEEQELGQIQKMLELKFINKLKLAFN